MGCNVSAPQTSLPEPGSRRESMIGGVPDSIRRLTLGDIEIEQAASVDDEVVSGEDGGEGRVRGQVVSWREVEAVLPPARAPCTVAEAARTLAALIPEVAASWNVDGECSARELHAAGALHESVRLMLDRAQSPATRRAATRLFLRLCDHEAAVAESKTTLDTLEAFELDLSCAVGSDYAAIVPAVHKESSRRYVLKMQKVWPPEEKRDVDDWGNPIVFANHLEQGVHEYTALSQLHPCGQVVRVAAQFEDLELEPPEEEEDEEYEMGLSSPASPLSRLEPLHESRSPVSSPASKGGGDCASAKTHYMVLDQWEDDGESMMDQHAPSGLEEREALLALLQLAMALEQCSRCGVIWNDAKLNNVLVDQRGAICLADFGLWSTIEDYQYRGSYFNKAPEAAMDSDDLALRKVQEQNGGIPIDHTKVDMWGLGCLAYQLCCGPHHHRDDSGHPFEMDMENMTGYLQGRYLLPDDIDSDSCDAVAKALLQPHPANRPSARTLVTWIRELLWTGATPVGNLEAREDTLIAVLSQIADAVAAGSPLAHRNDLTVEQEMLLEAICAGVWPDDS